MPMGGKRKADVFSLSDTSLLGRLMKKRKQIERGDQVTKENKKIAAQKKQRI